jgi:hypothetical protein
MLTKSMINALIAPLAKKLNDKGEAGVTIKIGGFEVTSKRLYKQPGRTGVAWTNHYSVVGDVTVYPGTPHERVVGVRSGNRDDMVAFIHRHQKRLANVVIEAGTESIERDYPRVSRVVP